MNSHAIEDTTTGAATLLAMRKEMEARVDTLFTYHPPSDAQRLDYDAINKAAKEFALVVLMCTPSGADQSAAIRKIREARMTANAAIACGGVS